MLKSVNNRKLFVYNKQIPKSFVKINEPCCEALNSSISVLYVCAFYVVVTEYNIIKITSLRDFSFDLDSDGLLM